MDSNPKIDISKKLEEAVRTESRSLAGFFIRNYRFTYLILIFVLIMGSYAMLSIPREAEPEVKVPFAVVTALYPGATPGDIEELVTAKIEAEVKNLDDLRLYTSESGSGISSVFVEFIAEADLEASFDKLRQAADRAAGKLPADAEKPLVTEINFNDFPIVTYSLTGDLPETELKRLADRLEEELESIRDVSKVEISGGLEREFLVVVSQEKLSGYALSLRQVIAAVSAGNFSLPAGNIEIGGFQYGVRVKGRLDSAAEMEGLVVATANGAPIYLRDLARIEDGFKEKNSESKIGFPGQAPRNSLSLQVYKKTGGNILNIVDSANKKIAALQAASLLPEELVVEKTNDNSVFIKEDLRTLGLSALQTMALINLILLIVLSFRGALITALSVPLAFLMAFIFLYLQGLTLNSMVLFSLVLSLGLMVDNAIVIIEGINEYVSVHRKNMLEAVLLSVWNFKWAITAGTLTTVAAFLPMLLVSGILGEYLSILPKTITVTLLSSLAIALVVIPTLAARFIKIKPNGALGHRNRPRHLYLKRLTGKFAAAYGRLMAGLLPERKKRRMVIAAAWLLFLAALAVPASGLMKVELFPKIDLDYFLVNVELPAGSTLEMTRPVAETVEAEIAGVPELKNYVAIVGGSAGLGFGDGGQSGEYLASFTVNLADKDGRERKSYEIAADLRSRLKAVPGAKITVSEISAGPPSGAPIEVRIFGDDLRSVDAAAKSIAAYFKEAEGAVNVRDSLKQAAGEFAFTVNREKADYYGLNNQSIAAALRQALYGTTASVVNIGGEDADITVKFDQSGFKTTADLENLVISSQAGNNIALKDVASVSLEPSLLSISRRNGEKVALVRADTAPGADLGQILADFESSRPALGLPADVSVQVGGELEDIAQSFRELFLSMGLAVVFIAFILVLQFNSFTQPFIIIFSVPLAFIGVIAGLVLLNMPFSFTAFIGIVSLAGIAVNDAIVLIDRINKNIRDGWEFYEAIIEGGKARMQPIFLTSLTTIAGVFPLVFASELWRGLSISMIFGLIASTALTLVITPLFYASLCFKEKCVKADGPSR